MRREGLKVKGKVKVKVKGGRYPFIYLVGEGLQWRPNSGVRCTGAASLSQDANYSTCDFDSSTDNARSAVLHVGKKSAKYGPYRKSVKSHTSGNEP